jgi:hypothetical protein
VDQQSSAFASVKAGAGFSLLRDDALEAVLMGVLMVFHEADPGSSHRKDRRKHFFG